MIRPVLVALWLSAGMVVSPPCDGRVPGGVVAAPHLAPPASMAVREIQDTQTTDDDDDRMDPPMLVAIAQLAVGVFLCLSGLFYLNHRRKIIGSMLLASGCVVFSAWPLVFWLW